MTQVNLLDRYLVDEGPAALVLREPLMSVEGPDGVVFPATFAPGDGFPGGYNIDQFPDGANVCLIDSVGSQANRIEPLFMQEKYRHLVPQIVIQVHDRTNNTDLWINLLEVGHRAADALARCSALHKELEQAFLGSLAGDAEPLAKLAPTSLVFGVWDSRGTQEKRPRLVNSVVRAFHVKPMRRSAVYVPPVNYAQLGIFTEEEAEKAVGDEKNPLSKCGFVHHPSTGHGGVIAAGGIRRDAYLSLAALRLLRAGNDPEKTHRLQRYILGLALVAFTTPMPNYLRQGCILVRDPSKPVERWEVFPSGDRQPFTLSHEEALAYATEAAAAFGVGPDRTVPFDTPRAKKEVEEAKKEETRKRSKKSSASQADSEEQ